MIFGLKNIPVELHLLQNDDEATPIRMIGAKQAPILERDDGTYLPESLDIVREIDRTEGERLLLGTGNPGIHAWLSGTKDYFYPLLFPRFATASLEEFSTTSARDYFTRKKEAAIGSFAGHLARSADYIALADRHLSSLATLMASDKTVGDGLSEDDLHVFATLRCLSIVQGITYPPVIESYRQGMSAAAGVPLFDAIAV